MSCDDLPGQRPDLLGDPVPVLEVLLERRLPPVRPRHPRLRVTALSLTPRPMRWYHGPIVGPSSAASTRASDWASWVTVSIPSAASFFASCCRSPTARSSAGRPSPRTSSPRSARSSPAASRTPSRSWPAACCRRSPPSSAAASPPAPAPGCAPRTPPGQRAHPGPPSPRRVPGPPAARVGGSPAPPPPPVVLLRRRARPRRRPRAGRGQLAGAESVGVLVAGSGPAARNASSQPRTSTTTGRPPHSSDRSVPITAAEASSYASRSTGRNTASGALAGRDPQRHAGADAVLPRLVGRRRHHAALGRVAVAADDHRQAGELGPAQHLDRGDELVEVDVQHPVLDRVHAGRTRRGALTHRRPSPRPASARTPTAAAAAAPRSTRSGSSR